MSKYDKLIEKFIDGKLSDQERETLKKWVLEKEQNRTFFKNAIRDSRKELAQDFNAASAFQKFSKTVYTKKTAPNTFYAVLKYAAVITILVTTGFFVKQEFSGDKNNTVITSIGKQIDLSEGSEIIIKLADGTTKILSSTGTETISDATGKVIARHGGNEMVFDNRKELTETEAIFNEVYIPYGQTFKLTLSDGTLVWLNAGSRLRFPQKFIASDKERVVYLEGEGFFEVTKNMDAPFIVNTQEVDVKVLGTKFNISSYGSDHTIATTLVEGSVSVYETRLPENAMLLTPNYQANYNKFENNFSQRKVNTEVFTAWMENRFVIDNLTFSEILTKLERRHQVKFVNNAKKLGDEVYKGEFENEGIESVLETISLSTPFQYEIQQNIITISD